MQGIIMQIFNGCFNSRVLALSQDYAAAGRVKMYAFIKTLCHMVFRWIKDYIVSVNLSRFKNANGKIT